MHTTTSTPADAITRPDWRGGIPAAEPDDNRRATVREWRREVAEWMRAHGVAAAGEAWSLATVGERDLTVLRRAAADDPAGAGLARHWSGTVLPAALADGDSTAYGVIVGAPVTDPDTGRVWVVTRRTVSGRTDHDDPTTTSTIAEHDLAPADPVDVTRGRGNIADRARGAA